ncbi:hypothetical protein MtrunA17_Chr7g0267841 [Medicago truncatula]|uniref:Transmembrane protein n=1 Tax=Medicago truncatula TaxID=3880 RepID=A0A396H6D9_MEDTR|nr:hypothetical protein MtrunA17_Chr7g0267841 [Medicago truncatula]
MKPNSAYLPFHSLSPTPTLCQIPSLTQHTHTIFTFRLGSFFIIFIKTLLLVFLRDLYTGCTNKNKELYSV